MKRMISFALALIMAISLCPASVFAVEESNSAIIGIETTSATPDSTVDVAVSISNNPGIASLGFTLSFDEALTLVGATNGEAFSEMTMTPPAQLKKTGSVSGSCRFAWLGNDNVTENGVILNLKFKVAADAELNKDCLISLSCEPGDVLDEGRNSVTVATKSGTVTIIDYTPGDVDGSGSINMLDVLTVCQYYVDGCKYDPNGYAVDIKPECGDVDANGKINMLDVLMLCQYYVDGCKYDPDGYGVKLLPGKKPCDHTMQEIPANTVTCIADDSVTYWHCTKCNRYFADESGNQEVTLKEHMIVIDPAVPATYEKTGLSEGSHCSVCHKVLVEQKVVPVLKPNTKSITYNIVNEAEHPYLGTLEIDTSALELSYVPGQALTLKNLDLGKYGYTFDGWYDGFGKNATQIKTIPATSNGDVTVYAHVTENVYDITYNLYQTPVGKPASEAQLHYTVSKGNANLYNPEINNYKFLGWYDNNGVEYKTIPVGTTGHITLNAYYASLRNLAVSKNDSNPLILEDRNNNVVYFTYEIGEIRNIPLNADKPFWEIQSVAGLSQQISKTYTTSISSTEAASVSKSISDMTVNSSTWTLSETWNDVTTVNESWAEQIGKTTQQSRTDATTSSNTLSISNQNGGSSYHKTEDGTTVYDYDSKTETKDKGHQFDASISGTYANKVSANLGASTEFGTEASYQASNAYTQQGKVTADNWSASGSQSGSQSGSTTASDKDKYSSGIGYENGFEVNAGLSYGYHNNTNTVTKTGSDSVTVNSNIDENTSSWNNSATFSATQQHSSSNTISNTLSDIVTTTKGYGSSYSKGGTDTSTQGFSSSSSNTAGTTSTVTYSKLESETTTTTYSVDGKIEGKYRSILVGKAHVFAVVGYDYNTKSFFTYTFSVMDDKTEEFLDYTPKGGNFDDCEYSCLPFEVPYFVFEYVNGKTVKTTGINYRTNSINGTATITGYTGNDTDVIVPSYVSDGKQAYKVTELSNTAFAGKSVRSVVLGEFIDTIPDGAFKNCTALEGVIGSFTKIGNEAFAGCGNLTNMNIPSNVVKIGTDAFAGVSSINVRAINSLCAYGEAVALLPAGTDDQIAAKQKEVTQNYIQSVLDCGADNIVLDISIIAEGTPLALEVPAINSIEINGGSKTYRNFSVNSLAKNTIINEMTVENSKGIPFTVDSEKLTLHKVFASANTTALILKRDGTVLSLVQDSAIQSAANYTIISKNPVIESVVTTEGASGFLNVSGNFGYVNSITGESYVDVTNGELKEMSEEEFGRYIQGAYTVTFDVNGGNALSEEDSKKTVYLGDEYGSLPTPTRDYYTFAGWYTDGGVQVTADSEFDEVGNVTLYAHWTQNALSGWVKPNEVPSGARIEQTKWTYTQRETKSSSKSSLDGWSLYDTKRTSWGNWSDWSKTDPSNGVRNVQSQSVFDHTEYHYFRWIRYNSNGSVYGVWDHTESGTVLEEQWFNYQLPVFSNGSYGTAIRVESGQSTWKYVWCEATVAGSSRYIDPTWSRDVYRTEWRYQEPVYTYYFERQVSMEDYSANPSGKTGVSNVQEWVRYIPK